MKNNIALIGFMGSGKTTTGKILADRLGYLFFDIDELIEISEQSEIKDIFSKYGEKYFRDIESKILEKISSNKDCVFACGGGVILREKNMNTILKNSNVVYLKISPSEAIRRLSDSADRPLLPDKNRDKKIHELINIRSEKYCKYADIIVKNEGTSPEAAVENIMDRINRNIFPK